jgi:GntR family transcriptional regulator, arabinose operon transcriptional repressor
VSVKYMYEKIAGIIRADIEKARQTDDEVWLSESKYSERLSVSRMTVRKAVDTLIHDGVVVRVPGKGVTVAGRPSGRRQLARKLAFLIKHDPYDDYFSKTITGCTGYANENEYYYTISNPNTFQEQQKQLERVLRNDVDGILLSVFPEFESEYDRYFARLEKKGIPFVLVDNVFDDATERWPYVVGNDVHGGWLATEYLLRNGHRKILFCYDRLDVHTIKLRMEGHRRALAEYDVAFDDQLRFNTAEPNMPERLFYLRERHGFTAATTYSDKCLSPVYHALSDLGYRIPEDISMVGYGNLLYSRVLEVPLTTVEVPVFDVGKHACQMLIDYLEGNGTLEGKVLDVGLIERASVKNIGGRE